MAVFVLDKRGKALMPCTEKRARLLLDRGRARVHKLYPFVIRLIDRVAEDSEFQELEVKLDPGSKITGIALIRKQEAKVIVLNLFELIHRGWLISKALTGRRQLRRGRRSRNLRYRQPRFLNRKNKKAGWLAPSLMHRIDTTMSWVNRLSKWAPVSAYVMELVRFDMQKMENPEINGVEYQQGELFGYEVREYLLEKWGRKCAYCHIKDVPLNLDHVIPKANSGSDRVSNLTLACVPCNQKKNDTPIKLFLAGQSERLAEILGNLKKPLKDAAAVNSTRWALFNKLKELGHSVECGSGGLTKFNRAQFLIPKTHALDAVCVGKITSVIGWNKPVLEIKCTGRGAYKRTITKNKGFPRGYLMRTKAVKGFHTGDRVKAVVTVGKKIGEYIGRVNVRASGSFNITHSTGTVQGIGYKNCKLLSRNDGYGYQIRNGVDMSKNIKPVKGFSPFTPLSLPYLKEGESRSTS